MLCHDVRRCLDENQNKLKSLQNKICTVTPAAVNCMQKQVQKSQYPLIFLSTVTTFPNR